MRWTVMARREREREFNVLNFWILKFHRTCATVRRHDTKKAQWLHQALSLRKVCFKLTWAPQWT
jgi:hypothetical protein